MQYAWQRRGIGWKFGREPEGKRTRGRRLKWRNFRFWNKSLGHGMMALSMLLALIFRELYAFLSGSNFNLTVPFVPRGCFVRTASITQLMVFIILSSSSSSYSWRVRRVSSYLILKMKLVPPALPRSSCVPSFIWFVLYGSVVVW